MSPTQSTVLERPTKQKYEEQAIGPEKLSTAQLRKLILKMAMGYSDTDRFKKDFEKDRTKEEESRKGSRKEHYKSERRCY